MLPKEKNITAEQVRKLFTCDPEKGELRWAYKAPKCRITIGELAGCKYPFGYVVTKINMTRFAVHRLIWIWVYGKWPDGDIDHINGIRDDNRISNLRDVTRSVNRENLKVALNNNKHGILGASWIESRKCYYVAIKVSGKTHFLGLTRDPEDARNRYLEAKRKLHQGCTI